jgi:hypothetical protein
MLFDIFPILLLSREKEVPVGTGGNGRNERNGIQQTSLAAA